MLHRTFDNGVTSKNARAAAPSGLSALGALAVLWSCAACGAAPDGTSTERTTQMGSVAEPLGLRRVAQIVTRTAVVSNDPSVTPHDTNLQNAWGLAFAPSGRAWVSDNGSGLSSVFDPNGATVLTVTIPVGKDQEPPSAPTGQLFNPDAASFQGDHFIFATEGGTIAGWQSGATATTRADASDRGAVYKGIAIAKSEGATQLYAADFHNAAIDVYDAAYMPVTPKGRFVDPFLPRDYAPFNLIAQDDVLFVSYAKQILPEREDDDAGAGHGFIDVFDTMGHFLQRLISRGELNSPWGMVVAPGGVGAVSNRLLVGNFGDGHINTYELRRFGPFRFAIPAGALGTAAHEPLVIEGLWALAFPPTAGGFDEKDLWFTAGPDDEANGVFGRIDLR
jgi:uncharacterized protein (TIGR03118 family)